MAKKEIPDFIKKKIDASKGATDEDAEDTEDTEDTEEETDEEEDEEDTEPAPGKKPNPLAAWLKKKK
jgi:hypothetical protein